MNRAVKERVSGSITQDPVSGVGVPRKPMQIEHDIRGSRPQAFVLRSYGERLFREWKRGGRIRQIARNHGTTVGVVEDILRETA